MINMEDKLTNLLVDSVRKNLNTHKENGRINLLNLRDVAKDLLNDGVILPLCKVGDELFRIIKLTNSACKPFVLTLPDKVEPYGIFYKGLMGEYRCIPFEEFGKTVFLTREEAEEALREKENDN